MSPLIIALSVLVAHAVFFLCIGLYLYGGDKKKINIEKFRRKSKIRNRLEHTNAHLKQLSHKG